MDPAARRLIVGHTAATVRLRASLLAYLTALWQRADYDKLDRYAVPAAAAVTGTQQRMASMETAYLAALLTVRAGERVTLNPPDPRSVTVEAIRGVSPQKVYGRAGETLRWRLSAGDPFAVASRKALDRVQVMASTDIQLARTHTVVSVLADAPGVAGYTRVTDGDPCELCATAATNFYRSSELMPIHDRCSCGVEPVMGDSFHAAKSVHTGQLKELQAAGISSAPGDADVAVRDHGEIGPVLTRAGDSFRGPDDL